jgi:tRNA(adenine34) deaminase
MLTRPDSQATDRLAFDREMMQRCIRLSASATEKGEFPFAAIVCEGNRVVVETINEVVQCEDVTRHAELLAVSAAQKALGRRDLSSCTLYSNVEPCAMCAFPIRETRIGRVIYSISSPMMGGFSKWNVLRDTEISQTMPEAFGPVPEVIAGLCQRSAEKVWWTWNPIIWAVIKHRGCFGRAAAADGSDHMPAIPSGAGFIRRLMSMHGRAT